ncbi:MAG: ComF family protein [Thiohalobacterales bacterium]|nr:ComF family protein [Thiohalobacterales bacterium]
MVYNWGNRLLDILFSPTCRLCGGRVTASPMLCTGCEGDLPRLTRACRQCARPLPAHGADNRCGHCQQLAPHFDRTTALCHYHPPVDYLLKRLKFAGDLGMAPLLAGLLARQLEQRSDPLPELLVPVPLHPARLRQRGYNQAIELARPLGRRLAIPLGRSLCRRTRRTETQSLLGTTARRLNMRNAFAVNGIPAVTRVAIVDDVMTTGSTAGELARTLKYAGVLEVEVWVIARAD